MQYIKSLLNTMRWWCFSLRIAWILVRRHDNIRSITNYLANFALATCCDHNIGNGGIIPLLWDNSNAFARIGGWLGGGYRSCFFDSTAFQVVGVIFVAAEKMEYSHFVRYLALSYPFLTRTYLVLCLMQRSCSFFTISFASSQWHAVAFLLWRVIILVCNYKISCVVSQLILLIYKSLWVTVILMCWTLFIKRNQFSILARLLVHSR